jgi:hypothetical protein
MRAGTAISIAAAPDASARRRAALGAVSAVAAAAGFAAVDPASRGVPLCPTNRLFDVDCPACGTLRGLHSLLRGDVATALDHNVLLVVAAPIAVAALVFMLAPLVGRPTPRLSVPRWVGVVAIVIAVAFTVLRNLPFDAFAYLASGA